MYIYSEKMMISKFIGKLQNIANHLIFDKVCLICSYLAIDKMVSEIEMMYYLEGEVMNKSVFHVNDEATACIISPLYYLFLAHLCDPERYAISYR